MTKLSVSLKSIVPELELLLPESTCSEILEQESIDDLPKEIRALLEYLLEDKGSSTSGHYGHSGLSGVWGGSTPSGGSGKRPSGGSGKRPSRRADDYGGLPPPRPKKPKKKPKKPMTDEEWRALKPKIPPPKPKKKPEESPKKPLTSEERGKIKIPPPKPKKKPEESPKKPLTSEERGKIKIPPPKPKKKPEESPKKPLTSEERGKIKIPPPRPKYKFAKSDKFVSARDEHLVKDYEAFLTPYTKAQYEKMGAKVHLSSTGRSGYALMPDGDVISVFAAKGSGEGREAILSAIAKGGTKLDCYDGKLVEIYSRFGFAEYDRLPWDDQYAHPEWNYKKFNRPDVVLMRLGRKK